MSGRISLAKQSTKAEKSSVAVTAAPAIAANILAAGILMLLLPVLAFRGKTRLRSDELLLNRNQTFIHILSSIYLYI